MSDASAGRRLAYALELLLVAALAETVVGVRRRLRVAA
jgi:hypothetical protein